MSQRAFRCPLCGSGFFRPVVIPRAGGSHYLTSFYECAGCSVMFIDPRAFNANEPGPPHSSGAQPPAAPPTISLDTYGRSSVEPAPAPAAASAGELAPHGKTQAR